MIFNRICMAFFSVKLNSFCWWKIKLHMGWSQNRVYSNNHSNRENHRQPEDWVVPDFQTNPSIVWYFLQLFWANMWQGKRFNTTQKKRFNRVAPLFRPKKMGRRPMAALPCRWTQRSLRRQVPSKRRQPPSARPGRWREAGPKSWLCRVHVQID